jgi:hypothetical protein
MNLQANKLLYFTLLQKEYACRVVVFLNSIELTPPPPTTQRLATGDSEWALISLS